MKMLITKRGKMALSACIMALFVLSVYLSYAFVFAEHVDEEEHVLASYCHTGSFDYEFTLKENVLFERKELEMGVPSFTKIVDTLLMHYQASFVTAPDAAHSVTYCIFYTVSSEHWQRRFDVLPWTPREGSYEEYFEIDFGGIAAYLEAVEKELSVVSREYFVKVHVLQDVEAECAGSTISQTYDDCFSFTITSNVITPCEDATCTGAGQVTETVTVTSSSGGVAKAGAIFVNMLLVVGAVLSYVYITPHSLPADEAAYRSARKHFKDYLMDAEGQPPKFSGTTIDVASLKDLLRIAVGLNKPILHYHTNGVHNYYVISDEGIYHIAL